MSENFDWVEGPAGSGGPLLAGDLFLQNGRELLLPAGYLVFGPADGPYTRVDTGSGLPVHIQNATLAATQSGSWTVTVANTLTVQATNLDVRDLVYTTDSVTVHQGGTWLVQSAQSGTWTVQAVQSGTWNVTALTSITNPVTVQDGGGSLTVDGAVTANQGGTWNITNVSGVVSLPTGAATAAKQDTGNAFLASIDGKITTCNTGAVTVAACVLPAGAATAAKQPALGVAGTPSADVLTVQGSAGMTALAVSGPLTDAQLRASAVPVSAAQSGTWNVGTVTTVTNVVHVDDNGGSLTIDGTVNVGNTVTVSDGGGSLTVDGVVTANQGGAWSVGVAGTVTCDTELTTADLDTGAGTDTRAVVGVVLAASGGGVLLGTANPMPVSDNGGSLTVDGTVTANQGGAWNIANISGTVSLPTGAATSAKQDTGNTSLASLDGKVTTCNTGAVTVSSSVLPTGAATAVKQPALGTAGTPSADVLTVQGTTGMTALKVDGSAVTQPVSGTFWPATQPVSGTITANQGGTWNVGTVTAVTNVVHVDDNAGSLTVDGTVTVQDGGGSLTVDGTVAATQQGTWATRLQDGAGNAVTSATRGGERALTVQVVDASGNQVTSFGGGGGGGTQYTEDAASSGGEQLTLAGAVRQDSPTATTSTDGDYTNLKTDSAGRLWVNNSGVTQPVSGTFWQATQPVSGTVTANQGGTWNIGTVSTVTNVVHVDDNSGSLTVDGTVAATQSGVWTVQSVQSGVWSMAVTQSGSWGFTLNPGSTVAASQSGDWTVQMKDGLGSLLTSRTRGTEQALSVQVVDGIGNQITSFSGAQATEDDVATYNPTGGMLMARRRDSLSSETTTDGDVTALNSTAKGELYVKQTDAVPVTDNGGSLTVDGTVAATQSGTWNVGTVTTITNVVHVDDNSGSLTVDNNGTFAVQAAQSGTWNVNNVSGTVSLPTGAAVAAKQPALGTAGTPSADVITIQGVTGMTALKVDGSGVTQPVSGTVTANQGGTWNVGAVTTITNVVHVDDNSSSLTVDNAGTFAVQAAQSGNWSVRAQDGAGNALTSAVRGSERALSIQVVDASGNQVTSFGGGTQYVEDAASAGGESLTLAGVVRQDTPAGSTSTDGDYTYLKSDSVGRLWVAAVQSGTWNVGTVTTITNVVHVDDNSGSLTVDNGGTFAVQDSQVLADNAGFTDGTSKVFVAGYIYDEVAGTALTENDVAAARINANRAQIHILEDASTRGRYAAVTASNALKVDASVAAISAKTQDGAGNNLTSAARGSERALSVQVVDASGNQITTFGGGAVTNAGTFAVQANLGATGTLTNVSGSASSVTLLASNAARRKAIIVNDSSATLYIKFGTTASTTSYSVPPLGPYEAWEETVYTGRIDGIWSSATGTARVTEVT